MLAFPPEIHLARTSDSTAARISQRGLTIHPSRRRFAARLIQALEAAQDQGSYRPAAIPHKLYGFAYRAYLHLAAADCVFKCLSRISWAKRDSFQQSCTFSDAPCRAYLLLHLGHITFTGHTRVSAG